MTRNEMIEAQLVDDQKAGQDRRREAQRKPEDGNDRLQAVRLQTAPCGDEKMAQHYIVSR